MSIQETVVPFRPWRLKLSRLQADEVKLYVAMKYMLRSIWRIRLIRFQLSYQNIKKKVIVKKIKMWWCKWNEERKLEPVRFQVEMQSMSNLQISVSFRLFRSFRCFRFSDNPRCSKYNESFNWKFKVL